MNSPRGLAILSDHRAGLRAEGWEERFTAAPPRLEEAIEVFRAAGFEIRLEPAISSPAPPDCAGCDPAGPGAATIWVRKAR